MSSYESEKKEGESKLKKLVAKNASPSKAPRTNNSTSSPSNKKTRRTETNIQEVNSSTAGVGAVSPRETNHHRIDSGGFNVEDIDKFWFEQDDDAQQENFFMNAPFGFWRFYENKQFIDCTITTDHEGVEYGVHKLILGFSSQFFFEAIKEAEEKEKLKKTSSISSQISHSTSQESIGPSSSNSGPMKPIRSSSLPKEEIGSFSLSSKDQQSIFDPNYVLTNNNNNVNQSNHHQQQQNSQIQISSNPNANDSEESSSISTPIGMDSVGTPSTESTTPRTPRFLNDQGDVRHDLSNTDTSNPHLPLAVAAGPIPVKVSLPFSDTEEMMPLILKYMYTGVASFLTPQNCVLISALAERLVMPKLQQVCKDYIDASLQRENAVELLLEASKYKAQNLLKRSISNVARNFCHIRPKNVSKLNYAMFSKVLSQDSLAVADEYQLYQVVCEYCKVHKDILSKQQILKLMSNIRFRWLSYERFVEVSNNPLVPKSLIIEAAMARLMPHELSSDEVTKRNTNLPEHLKQRPKFSILFEYTPPQQQQQQQGMTLQQLQAQVNQQIIAGFNQNSNNSISSSLSSSPQQMYNSNNSNNSGNIQMNPLTNLSAAGPSSSSTGPSHSGGINTSSINNSINNPLSSSSSNMATYSNGISSTGSSQTLPTSSDGAPDIFNGIIGWIATNGNRDPWKNAHVAGRVKVHSSSLAKGSRSTLVDKVPAEVWTNDIPCSWISIDLGPYRRITPTWYTLRHGLNYRADSLRTWDLQASNDGIVWKTLKRHANDKSLNAPFVAASWPVTGVTEGFRFFRILQVGHNSSNHNFLALSGFEFYGWLDTHT